MTPIFTEQNIKSSLQDIGTKIISEHSTDLAFIGIGTKGFLIANRLLNICKPNYNHSVQVGLLDIALYNPKPSPGNFISLGKTSIQFSLKHKNVILISDQINTGKTVVAALNALLDYDAPREIMCCCLLSKNNLKRPIHIQYPALTIPKENSPFNKTTCSLFEVEGEDNIYFTEEQKIYNS